MNKWFRLSKTEAWVLAVVSLVLLALVLTEVSTVRERASRVCTNCLARRRTVLRTVMWRVVEKSDVVYPLEGNEDIKCQHSWIGITSSRWSGLGGGYVADGDGSIGTPELQKAIEAYEKRTGRNYHVEVQKSVEAARKASAK